MTDRVAAVTRKTGETTVDVTLEIDGTGEHTIETGVGFFDHMLETFAVHGAFDMTVRCEGDLEIDAHHSVEDVALTLGVAVDEALGDRNAIERFGDRRVPLDEAVATVTLDVSGRGQFYFDGEFAAPAVGELPTDMARHFFGSLARTGGLTLHTAVTGTNAHHQVEAMFKGVARTLDDATRIDDRRTSPPSTKDTL